MFREPSQGPTPMLLMLCRQEDYRKEIQKALALPCETRNERDNKFVALMDLYLPLYNAACIDLREDALYPVDFIDKFIQLYEHIFDILVDLYFHLDGRLPNVDAS